MSSRVRGKENARARAAEMRAAEARATRKRRILAATSALAVVILVVAALVVTKLTGKDSGTTTATPASGSLPASVLKDVTTVPAATADKVGAAGVTTVPTNIKAPALTADGKPKVLYVGADYCPFCAAERWPLVVALSRFGTWSGLGATSSSATDEFPNTPTLSFHGAKLTSDVLTFAGFETSDKKQAPLDKLPADDQKTFDDYNKPPYVTGATGGIPFINIGGTYVSSGASFSPEILKAKTRAQIAKAIGDPSSDIGKAVLANSNVIAAAICDATGDKPSTVCTSSGVKAGAVALAQGQKK